MVYPAEFIKMVVKLYGEELAKKLGVQEEEKKEK